MRETWVQSLGQEDPLEKEMAIHSSTIAWKSPWTEEPGRLQSTGSQRVEHDWATSLWSFSLLLLSPLCHFPSYSFSFFLHMQLSTIFLSSFTLRMNILNHIFRHQQTEPYLDSGISPWRMIKILIANHHWKLTMCLHSSKWFSSQWSLTRTLPGRFN